MGKFGQTAVRATELLRDGKCGAPTEAWQVAAREVFPGKPGAQKKACPRATFLGLCEEGLVVGVAAENSAAGEGNRVYAVEAVRLLHQEPALAEGGPTALWWRVMYGRDKVPNHQMDVVLTLWELGLIGRGRPENPLRVAVGDGLRTPRRG
jgi:uncharacterized protein DUF6979